MFDTLCDCDTCEKLRALEESTFQTETTEKQGVGAETAGGTTTGAWNQNTQNTQNTPKQPPSLRQRINTIICRIVGHDWDEFDCYRCGRRLMNITRIPTKVRRA